VNAAFQVDLLGAVNAEVAGTRQLSGPGGMPDFAQSAQRIPGGVSIVTVAAAHAGASTVLARLTPPARTTLPAWLADRVVTEFGVARVRRLGERERADALLAVADPELRASIRPS
jgi:4-hydroxybutyrate CoA-transferase